MVIIWLMMVYNNLVGGCPTPLKNMSSSVGMMKFPTEWKNENVPNTNQSNIRCEISIFVRSKFLIKSNHRNLVW